jgi:hypothetical protein
MRTNVGEGPRRRTDRPERSPDLIRAKTIEKMNILRQEFISLVQSIYEKEGVTRSFQTEWDGVFINKMLKPQSHLHTLDRIMKV